MRIRPYRKTDSRDFLHLVAELARYEKLKPPTPSAGRRMVRDIGRRIHVLMAEHEGRAIGYAIYFFTYSSFLARPTLYLEDVFVLESERGQGAGQAFFAALRKIARRTKCGRMEWTVLDWNTPSIRFYEAQGARLMKEWILCRLSPP